MNWSVRNRVACALAAALLGLACGAPVVNATPVGSARASTAPPNVIVIVADDLGYGDLSAYGGAIPTPSIDALGRSGVRFTDAYVTAAVCAPSRAALLTGRAQTRFGFEFNPVGRDESVGPPVSATMMPAVMKRAGYATGMVGKWHLGQAAGYHPLDRGFDEYFGLLSGATSYVVRPGPTDETALVGGDGNIGRERAPIYRGRARIEAPGYLTDVLTDEAVSFIGRHADRPFFLYLAYNAPHIPLQATKPYLDRFRHISDPHQRVYSAMVSALDDGVGRVVAELDRKNLRSRTVVVFLSDNGCARYARGACTNRPLSGWKAHPWEGGVRVPFIVSWPGELRPRVFTKPVSSLDLLPTLSNVAGADAGAVEGVDLMPYLRARAAREPHRALYWRMGPNHAVRQGRWKLVVVNRSETVDGANSGLGAPAPDGQPAEVSPLGQWRLLYDLRADPGELHDLALRYPQIVRCLERGFRAWDRSNVAPIFPSRRHLRSDVNGHKAQLFN